MKCLNWKVIAGLGGLGIGTYLVAPGVAAAAVPLLVLAACPLSMLLMMRAMGTMGRCTTSHDADELRQSRSGEPVAERAPRG